jgi:cold-inducible RNA-binding protein
LANKGEATVMSKKLYIGNLGPKADKSHLEALFSIFGKVETAYIVVDTKTGQSKGYGFVVMADDAQAQAAIKALDKKDVGGFTVKVNEAKAKR